MAQEWAAVVARRTTKKESTTLPDWELRLKQRDDKLERDKQFERESAETREKIAALENVYKAQLPQPTRHSFVDHQSKPKNVVL